ncbi:MAG: hypothetical protein OEV42_03475 [Deltaproteobacteria bacterium]|nr:hypothetical protein [Deltaproteobacteria bacterium]
MKWPSLNSFAGLYGRVLGINGRNIDYVYKYNPRRYFNVADDKVKTKEYLVPAGIPVPKNYLVLSAMSEINSAWERIVEIDEFAIKPARGKAGGGILVAEKSESCWKTAAGRLLGADQLKKQMADIIFGVYSFGLWDRVLIEHRVHPHPFFTALYPHGVADLRIITCKGKNIMAMARIPTSRSEGKGNLHQGAIGLGIDIKTGVTGRGFDGKGYLLSHPDSGCCLEGLEVPFWQDIISISKAASRVVPLDYLGIDIVIDKTQGPLVMEINARPGLEIQNVNAMGLKEIMKEVN